MDAFSPPAQNRSQPPPTRRHLIVDARSWLRLSAVDRGRLAATARVPADHLDALARDGLPAVLFRSDDILVLAQSKAVIEELHGVTPLLTAPVGWRALFVLVGGSALVTVGAAYVVARDFIVDDDLTYLHILVSAAAITVATAMWLGPVTARRRVRAARADDALPEPAPLLPLPQIEAIAASDPKATLGQLGAVILGEPRGAPRRVAALRLAASARAAAGNALMARRLALRADREEQIADPSAGLARPVPPPLPWQRAGLLVVPATGGEWVEICPLCNTPGRHRTRVAIMTSGSPPAGLALLALLTGGLLLLLLVRGQPVPTTAWLCDAHHAARRRPVYGIVASVLSVPLTLYLAAKVGLGFLLLTFGAVIVVLVALGRRHLLHAQGRFEDQVHITGAHPDFVASRPLAP